MTHGTCSSCGEAIGWVVLAKSHQPHPVNLDPDDEEGTILYPGGFDKATQQTLGWPLRKKERKLLTGRGELYVSHFATCPEADKHRRRDGRSA